MSDILDRAEDLAERYNSSGFIHKEATLLLPELIAEIKQQAAYVARLEAAYLDEARENIQATREFLQEQQTPEEYQAEKAALARAALERIKNGDE